MKKGIMAIDALTEDILMNVFKFLTPQDLACSAMVCPSWNSIIMGSPSLWERSCLHQASVLECLIPATGPSQLPNATGPSQLPNAMDSLYARFIGSVARNLISTQDDAPSPSVRDESQSLPVNTPATSEAGRETARIHGGSARPQEAQLESLQRWRMESIDAEQHLRMRFGATSVRILRGHSGRVNCCQIFQGRVASGASDATVRLWSARSGSFISEYQTGGRAGVVGVHFDENKVLGAAGSSVFVWNRSSGNLLKRFGGTCPPIHSFCVHDDSQPVVGCDDGTVRIFDVYSGRCDSILRQHARATTAIAVSPGGLVASAGADGTLCVQQLSGEGARLTPPDFLLTAGLRLHLHWRKLYTSLHWTADERSLLIGSSTGHIFKWDLRCSGVRKANACIDFFQISMSEVVSIDQQSYGRSTFLAGSRCGRLSVCTVKDLDAPQAVRMLSLPSSTGMEGANVLSSNHSGKSSSTNMTCASLGFSKVVAGYADHNLALWSLHSQ